MPSTFYRSRFTWLAYLILAFYSYFLNIIGPITPFLKDELKLSYTLSNLHSSAFAMGMLLVGLVGHIPIQRLGRRKSMWVGAAGLSLGGLLLAAGRGPVVTIGASFLMGTIGSLILAIIPSALSDEHGELRAVPISESNVMSSLIASAGPLLVGWFALTVAGWRAALVIGAFGPLILYLIFRKVKLPAANASGGKRTAAQDRQALPATYWVLWLALALGVAIEFCMIYWSADYLEIGLGMLKANAAQAVSLFLGAMIVGRIAGGRLVLRYSARALVLLTVVIASVGFLVFWNAASAVMGMLGLFITGLGVASMYPLILSLAIGAANGNTVLASARAALASGTAIVLLPLVLARLADSFGIRQAYGVVGILLATIFVIILFSGRMRATAPQGAE